MDNFLLSFKVNDKQTFTEFIDLLRQDFIDNPTAWENDKLDTFLEAISAYANDIQGYYDNNNQNVDANLPSWQTFADIFKGATMYE